MSLFQGVMNNHQSIMWATERAESLLRACQWITAIKFFTASNKRRMCLTKEYI